MGRKRKLTSSEVKEIRSLYFDQTMGWTAAALARSFYVSTNTIWAVIRRQGAYYSGYSGHPGAGEDAPLPR